MCRSDAEALTTHQTFDAVRTCDQDILGENALDEVEGTRDECADGADRADRAAGIAAARSLERLVREGQHGSIGRVGGRQPVDTGIELAVGGEEAALVAAHTDRVFVSKSHKPESRLPDIDRVKTVGVAERTCCCC